VIWQTIPVGDPPKNYVTQGPLTVWKEIVLEGQASSSGPNTPDLKGKVTAFNRTNVRIYSVDKCIHRPHSSHYYYNSP